MMKPWLLKLVAAALCLAASLPMVGKAAPRALAYVDGSNLNAAETSIASAATVNLGGVSDGWLYVTGTTGITSFGTATAGTVRHLRFASRVRITASSALLLPNNGQNIVTATNDTITAVSLGSGNWIVTDYQPAAVWSVVDESAHGGALPYRFAVGGDPNSDYPDFAVDGGTTRTKTLAKSLYLYDPGDTVDLAFKGSDVSGGSPTAWTVPAYMGSLYCYPLDNSGAFAPTKPRPNATYQGWCAAISFGTTEVPTTNARGGAVILSATPTGQVNMVNRAWVSTGVGMVLPGLAAYETSGVSLPYIYAAQKNIWAPGPVNWADVGGWGNLSLVASDDGNGVQAGVIAIRKNGTLTAGWDLTWDQSADELQLNTVSGSTRSARIGIDASGNLLPLSVSGVYASAGSASRPFGTVAAQTLYETASHTPASASESCTAGRIAWDSGYIYVCVAANSWKRSALSTW